MYRKFSLLKVLLIFSVLIFSSCAKNNPEDKKVDKLKILQGDSQSAFAGEELKKEIKIELLGPNKPGLLGGKGASHPVSGIKVRLENIEGADLLFSENEIVSDSGGMVRFKVRTGRRIGDNYFRIIPEGFEKKSLKVRVINGLHIEGSKQETLAGKVTSSPLKVILKDADNNPIKGAKVFFRLASSPEKKVKAHVKKSEVLTNKEGMAETFFKIGKNSGIYKLIVEVVDEKREVFIRAVEVKEMGLNIKVLIFTVLGGLAIFIFGMKQMSDGLQMVAGERMKTILRFFARNRIVAVLAGALVTGVIQSSSACTVMVVGFVNAGLLNLSQAIGIVFGANIGTTITAQMISFKLGGLAFPAIIFGVISLLMAKKNTAKGWGQTLLGFGLLFYGMGIMGGELKMIGKFPSFIEFFSQFDCSPVNGKMPFTHVLGAIGIGTAMTVLIQSSSATIGIALALAMGGLINFYTAMPLILGDNIGTTVTAVLASLGANQRAKQTALAHLLFNLFGTFYMICLFFVPWPGTDIPVFLYFIDYVTPGNVFAVNPENISRHIAMGHSMFNVFNVLLFLPFIGLIAKVCNMIIPIPTDSPLKLHYLDPRLLATPAVAIEQSVNSIRYMVKESWSMIQTAVNDSFFVGKVDEELNKSLAIREEKVDRLQEEVTSYLSQLTRQTLTEPQSDIIPNLMHCTNDAERIADHTEIILGLARRISKQKLSEKANSSLAELWASLGRQAESTIDCLHNTDSIHVNLALKEAKNIQLRVPEMEKSHVRRLKEKDCEVVAGVIFIEMLTEADRISSHLRNIAERATDIHKHYVEL